MPLFYISNVTITYLISCTLTKKIGNGKDMLQCARFESFTFICNFNDNSNLKKKIKFILNLLIEIQFFYNGNTMTNLINYIIFCVWALT